MQRYIFTFGSGQRYAGRYVEIIAPSWTEARNAMCGAYGVNWSMQYDEDQWTEWITVANKLGLPVETHLLTIHVDEGDNVDSSDIDACEMMRTLFEEDLSERENAEMVTIVGKVGCIKCVALKEKLIAKGLEHNYVVFEEMSREMRRSTADLVRQQNDGHFPMILRNGVVIKEEELYNVGK